MNSMIAMTQTFVLNIEITQLLEILLLAFLGFAFSMLITPLYTTLAYRGEWWKKARSNAVTGEKAKIFNKLHAEKHRSLIPTMAGIVFLLSVTIVTVTFNLIREETWLPLAAFVGAGAVVTRNIAPYSLVAGNPAKQIGWMSEYGCRLNFDKEAKAICEESKEEYILINQQVSKISKK